MIYKKNSMNNITYSKRYIVIFHLVFDKVNATKGDCSAHGVYTENA